MTFLHKTRISFFSAVNNPDGHINHPRDPYNLTYLNAVPLCLVPIIVRTFYDTRLALFVHIITIIILGFLVPNSFEFLYMQLITGIIAIISVVNLTRRSQFFFASMMIFLSYSLIYVGMTLMQDGSLADIDRFSFVLFGSVRCLPSSLTR
jgi:membrane-associated HD superfamily phosphohydrolase